MQKTSIKEEKEIISIIKGVGVSLLVTILLLLIFSEILTYTNLQENLINPVIIIITAISILIGSTIQINKIKKNGILNGMFIGMIYMITIYFISSILNWKFNLNIQSLIMIFVGIIFGMIGGIIGVNKK